MRTNLLFLALLVLGAACIIFSYMPRGLDAQMTEIEMQKANWIAVEDYAFPGGWKNARDAADKDARARALCRELEAGRILYFPKLPYDFPSDEREFLLSRKWNELRLHKNVSYRPADDVLRGFSGDHGTVTHLHHIVRSYSAHVIGFLRDFLRPYADKWKLDWASFRPLEEEGRDLRCTSATICCTWTPSACGHARRAHPARVYQPEPDEAAGVGYAVNDFGCAGGKVCCRRGREPVRGEERICAAQRFALGGGDGHGAAEPHAV